MLRYRAPKLTNVDIVKDLAIVCKTCVRMNLKAGKL